jgi:UDP-N-acetylmuramyl tripeptide synthase
MATRTLRGGEAGRIVVVFGCGGDRDRGKRPVMGEIASRFADAIVLTSDNPRSESPAAIVSEIRAGIVRRTPVTVELDRRKAIARALAETRAGDVVVVAGKGHETTQQFAERALPFDDREVVANELRRLGRRAAS